MVETDGQTNRSMEYNRKSEIDLGMHENLIYDKDCISVNQKMMDYLTNGIDTDGY